MNATSAAVIAFGIFGYIVGTVSFFLWRLERYTNIALIKDRGDEAARNRKAFNAGVRTGHLESDLGIVRIDMIRDPGLAPQRLLDDLFPGTTPKDFPRPMGVRPPTKNDPAA